MNEKIIDGRSIAEKIRASLKKRIEELKFTPHLVIILVGEDERSRAYIRQKQKAAEEIGAAIDLTEFSQTVTQEDLEAEINRVNNDKNVDGIIVQLPLPPHLDSQKAIGQIQAVKDVDGFIAGSNYKPAAAAGILELLKEYQVPVAGKNAVVIGSTGLVGATTVQLLKEEGAQVTGIDENTPRPYDSLVQQGDIIVAAVGKARLVTANMVKTGAVVIDVGTNVDPETGKLIGDVDFENVKEKASLITPVPGGVGPMTVAMLMKNLLTASEERHGF